MENPLFKLAKKLCDGKHGFKVSPIRDGSGRDITFNRGNNPYRQEICISDERIPEISLTYWRTPQNFVAADRVRIKLRLDAEFYKPLGVKELEMVLENITRDYDEIVNEYRYYRHNESSSWLAGEMPFDKFMELEQIRLNTGASCNGCQG